MRDKYAPTTVLVNTSMQVTTPLYPFLVRHADGSLWPATRSIFGLTSAWNHATNPALPMTDREHARAKQYARAIRNRMFRIGFRIGKDYKELSDGSLWPIKRRPTDC